MKVELENVWNEYFADECSAIDTEEERELTRKAASRHTALNEMLTGPQREALESYVDILCEVQSRFIKKAFFKGCRFAAVFFSEINIP